MGWSEPYTGTPLPPARSTAVQVSRTVLGVELTMVGVSTWVTPDGVWVLRELEGDGWWLSRADGSLISWTGQLQEPVRTLQRGVQLLVRRGLIEAGS